MLQLSQRPLSASDADAALFVGRTAELDQLQRAYRLSFNTLLLAERGAGTTSLVRQLQRILEADGVQTYYCDVSGLTTVEQFIAAVQRARQGVQGPEFVERDLYEDIVATHDNEIQIRRPDIEWQLLRLGDHIAPRPLFILDAAHDPTLIHTVFGRFRDQIWELPFTWLICGLRDRRSSYLQPPADAFFDALTLLTDLDDDQSEDLLLRRLDSATARESDSARRILHAASQVVGSAAGNPRRLLAAAREVALGDNDTADNSEQLLMAAAKIGRPAAMLVAELRDLGSASASDEELLSRLGWTRARATQVFKQLLEAGVVVSHHERQPGAAGRPRTVYRLNVGGSGRE